MDTDKFLGKCVLSLSLGDECLMLMLMHAA